MEFKPRSQVVTNPYANSNYYASPLMLAPRYQMNVGNGFGQTIGIIL